MPRRKPVADGGDDKEETPLFTLGQTMDKRVLKKISMLRAVGEWEQPVNDLLDSCAFNRNPVDYMPGDRDKQGRAFGHGSIGNVPKWIMRLASGAFYESIDISNAAATILVQLADRAKAVVPALFRKFVNGEREAMQKLLLEQVSRPDTPANRKWAKKRFNSVINQKSVLRDYAIDCPLMRDWSQACKSLGEQLKRANVHAEVWELVKSLDDKPNKLATFVSYVYQREELKIMMAVMKYLQSQNFYVGVYKYDELLVETESAQGGDKVFTSARLASIRAHVKKVLGLDVEFHSDSYLPTVEDQKKLYGPVNLNKLPNEAECCRELLVRYGYKNKLLRYEGFILKPHAHIPGAYEYSDDYGTFATEVLKSSIYYTENVRSGNDALDKYLSRVTHPFFPLMTQSSIRSDWISFRNCSFNIKTLEYRTWADFEEKGEPAPFTDHFYDFEIDFAKLTEATSQGDEYLTPLWSNMLKLQLSEEMGYVFEVLVGRLMYRLGEFDNWQVMPFLLGDGGAGKGTVLELIALMKPKGKTGVMSKNMEERFGLEGLYRKELVMCMDLAQNFASVLDQATMQSCITGENVAVPRKNKTAVTDLRWTPPLIMAGNWVMNYNDERGQWKRRLALFLWPLIPGRVQSDLKERIAKNELAYVLLRCIARYRIAVQEKPGADFWRDIAPEELRQNQKYVESRMNVLARFLHEGSKEHGVIPNQGRLTPWADFISVYEGYLKEMKQSSAKADNIPDSALRQNGFKVFPPRTSLGAGRGVYKKDGRVNYCSFCPHSKSQVGHECDPAGICRDGLCWQVNCGDKGHKDAGRGKSYGIVNMRIVPKAEFDQWLLDTTEASSEPEPDESTSESSSVREWQERVWALAAQENTEKIRRATKKC